MLKRFFLLMIVFILTITMNVRARPVQADCSPDGNALNNLINCTGTDSTGVDGQAGSDTILIDSNAIVAAGNNSTETFVVSGGTGNDSIVNNGLLIGHSNASGFTDVMVGGGGVDTLVNNGTIIAN